MEIRPDRQNETQFLPGSGRIDTAIWMHYMDTNKTANNLLRNENEKYFFSSVGNDINMKC